MEIPNDGCLVNFKTFSDIFNINKCDIFTVLLTPFYLLNEQLPHQFADPIPHENRDLRLLYLLKELSKKKLSEIVQRRDKKYVKDLEIHQIFDTCVGASNNLFTDLIEKSVSLGRQLSDYDLVKIPAQIFHLLKFINKQLFIIGKKFKIKPKYIIPMSIDINGDETFKNNIYEIDNMKFKLSTDWDNDLFGVTKFEDVRSNIFEDIN